LGKQLSEKQKLGKQKAEINGSKAEKHYKPDAEKVKR
jgi:hypothetical protein